MESGEISRLRPHVGLLIVFTYNFSGGPRVQILGNRIVFYIGSLWYSSRRVQDEMTLSKIIMFSISPFVISGLGKGRRTDYLGKRLTGHTKSL